MDITATTSRCHVTRASSRDTRQSSRRHIRSGRLYATERGDSTRRRGLSALELVVIIALVIAVVIAAVVSGSRSGAQTLRTNAVKVGAGESLWSIAASNPVAGLTTEQTVDVIRRANGLRGNTLAAGSVIKVPVAPGSDVALAR